MITPCPAEVREEKCHFVIINQHGKRSFDILSSSDVEKLSSSYTNGFTEKLNIFPGGNSPSDSQQHITAIRVEVNKRYYTLEG